METLGRSGSRNALLANVRWCLFVTPQDMERAGKPQRDAAGHVISETNATLKVAVIFADLILSQTLHPNTRWHRLAVDNCIRCTQNEREVCSLLNGLRGSMLTPGKRCTGQ
jgi:hypothetical protein